MLALMAALAVAAIPTTGQPTCKAHGAMQVSQTANLALLYRSDGKAQASRLGDLPKANHEKAVMRTVGGCAAPLYVETGVGR